MGKKMKIIVVIVALLVISGVGQRMMDKTMEDKETIKEEVVRIVDHDIVNKENFPTANAKRYQLDVVVKEEATEKELKALAENIVEAMKEEEDFNAISIGFYDDEKDVGNTYTLGSIDYAPNGNWGDASSVKAGQYKKMEYSYQLIKR